MAAYIVWNKENTGCDTYEELLVLEQDGYGHSSEVSTDNIAGIIDAVLNETNADFGYHRVPVMVVKPLPNLTNERIGQIECNGCIIGDKVYQAVEPVGENDCTGCAFNTGGITKHCAKLKCSPVYRDDGQDVIWIEHTTPYTGHKV